MLKSNKIASSRNTRYVISSVKVYLIILCSMKHKIHISISTDLRTFHQLKNDLLSTTKNVRILFSIKMEDVYRETFRAQVEYLENNITDEDLRAIAWYTNSANNYDTFNEALYRQYELSPEQSIVYTSFKKLLGNIPPLEKPVVVFRGIKADELNQQRLMTMLSTSLSQTIAWSSEFTSNTCCFSRNNTSSRNQVSAN